MDPMLKDGALNVASATQDMPARDIRSTTRKHHAAEGKNRYGSNLAQQCCVFMLETLST
jgi:hypothetical protein